MSGYSGMLMVSWATVVVLAFGGSVGRAQPIDPARAVGSYSGGGITLSGDDVRRIAWGDGEAGLDGIGSPRGGGAGNVLIVECNGAFGFSTIQSAIDAAADGDVVVVLPNDCSAEGRWFENLVILDKAIRLQSANPADEVVVDATVIDGNAAGSVVTLDGGDGPSSVLDGLVITNGLATGFAGGGITSIDSGATIRRCVIANNHAERGGGLLSRGSPSPTLEGCSLSSNSASIFGSAVSLAGIATFPRLVDCQISNHSGAITYYGHAGLVPECEPAEHCYPIENCRFYDNTSNTVIHGDGLTISQCEFIGNSGRCINGGGVVVMASRFEANTASLLIQCSIGCRLEQSTFIGNSGGDVCLIGRASSVRECVFESNNTALGVMFLDGRASDLINCVFTRNSGSDATLRIGSLDGALIEKCRFVGNASSALRVMSDAGPSNWGAIHRCQFEGNASVTNGGAIRMLGGVVSDCLFIGNIADGHGGAIYATNAVIQNCTIIGNLAKGLTGGVFAGRITNSIIYNNRDAFGDGHQSQASQATTAAFSNIQNLRYRFTLGGVPNALAGNISLNPRFVDPGYWDDMGTPGDLTDDVFVAGDYHLLPDSPCIDGGDPAFVAGIGAMDFDGESRVMSCRVDMGVDEFTQDDVDVVGDFDGDGDVTVDDLPAFLSVTLDPLGLGVCRADVNGDGLVDGRDVAAMVAILVAQ